MFQLDLEKVEEPEIKLPTSVESSKKQDSRKISTSALLTTIKPLTMWITTNWQILKEIGIPDHLTCLLRNLYAGQEATVRTGHETTDWFQIGKGVCQGCILSPCLFNIYRVYYIIYIFNTYRVYHIQSISCEMPDWMKHKLESRLPGEMSIISDMQMTPPLWQTASRTKEPLDESERGK